MRSAAKSVGPGYALPLLREFLNFCRIEKGLSTNSLQAYTRDLQRFGAFVPATRKRTKPRFLAAKRSTYISILYTAPGSPAAR